MRGDHRHGVRPECAMADASYHESSIDEAMRPTTLAVEDPMAVFAFVFGSLPDRVKVYPTENYYYFRSYRNRFT
jgi:hypothetical protein